MHPLSRHAGLLIGVAALACASAPRQGQQDSGGTPLTRAATAPGNLAQAIQARIAAVPGAHVGVAYVSLGNPADTLYLNADSIFHAASTMKVPVMMRLYREVDAGRLDLDQRVPLVNRFISIVDGSPYRLDAGDDSDSAMYRRIGDSVTTRTLIHHMITRSSNLATNTLIARANPDSVNAMMRTFGATRMRVLRGVEDLKAFDRGMNNTATARDLATLLVALQTGRAASPASTRAMRETLLEQHFNEKIPAGLPAGTPVAHKTGDITGVAHDAAIVFPRERPPYVLVVLTKDIPQERVANSMIADISRLVYAHATQR